MDFMKKKISLGHMTPVTSDKIPQNYFFPHHGWLNDNCSTNKLRVVFNISSKSTKNDILLTGKKLQSDIFIILSKFRLFLMPFFADIHKMYRQVLTSPEDTIISLFFAENPCLFLSTWTCLVLSLMELRWFHIWQCKQLNNMHWSEMQIPKCVKEA